MNLTLNKTGTIQTVSLLTIVAMIISPLFAFAQSNDDMDDNAAVTTQAEVTVTSQESGDSEDMNDSENMDDTDQQNDENTDDSTVSQSDDNDTDNTDEQQTVIDQSEPVDESDTIVEGEVIETIDGTTYVQTDDGIVAVSSSDNVIIKSRGGSRYHPIAARVGQRVTLASGNEIEISQEIRGQLVSVLNGIATYLDSRGQQRTVPVAANATIVNAQGTRVPVASLTAGSEIFIAQADDGQAVQIITGDADEIDEIADLEEDADEVEEEEGSNILLFALAAIVIAGLTFFFLRK